MWNQSFVTTGSGSSRLAWMRPGCLVAGHARQGVYPGRLIVEARDERELAAARFEKRFFRPHSYLLDCFRAVHCKCRTNNHQLSDTRTGQADDLIVRTGLQPGTDAQPRLKGETEAAAGEASDSHESIHCFKA